MTISGVSDAWKAAMQSATEPMLVLKLHLSTSSSVQFCTGQREFLDSFPAIRQFKPISQKQDPLLQKVSTGAWEFQLSDSGGYIRTIIQNNVTKNRVVEAYIGDVSMSSLGEMVPLHKELVVLDIKPSGHPARFNMYLLDPYGALFEGDIWNFVSAGPPLKMARDVLERIGTTDWTAASSLDEKNHSEISHICMSMAFLNQAASLNPFPEDGMKQNTYVNAKDVVQGLVGPLGGAFVPGEAGEFEFKLLDLTESAVRHFDQFEMSNFRQLKKDENAINQVSHKGGGLWTTDLITLDTARDGQAQSDFKLPLTGARDWISEKTLESPYLGRSKISNVASLNAAATTLRVTNPQYHGFTGTHQEDASGNLLEPPSTSQQAEHQINPAAGRYGYFLLTDKSGSELVRVTAYTPDTSGGAYPISEWPAIPPNETTDPLVSRRYWAHGLFTIERGYAGTTPIDFTYYLDSYATAWDITPIYLLNRKLVQRFGRGAPVCQFDVSLRHWDLQLGDVVTFTHEEFVMEGHYLADATVRHTIVGKSLLWSEARPCVRLLTCYLASDTITIPTVEDIPLGDSIPTADPGPDFYYDQSGDAYVDASGDIYVVGP